MTAKELHKLHATQAIRIGAHVSKINDMLKAMGKKEGIRFQMKKPEFAKVPIVYVIELYEDMDDDFARLVQLVTYEKVISELEKKERELMEAAGKHGTDKQ